MCATVYDKHVENNPVHRWQTFNITNQFLVYQPLVCLLAVVCFFPYPFRNTSDFRRQIIFSQLIDGRIDNNPFHPGHQESFRIAFLLITKSFNVPEYFNKSVIGNIHCYIIPVYVSECNFQSVAIKSFIKDFLALRLLPLTPFYNLWYIQNLLISVFGYNYRCGASGLNWSMTGQMPGWGTLIPLLLPRIIPSGPN